jgi:hypothetical protein
MMVQFLLNTARSRQHRTRVAVLAALLVFNLGCSERDVEISRGQLNDTGITWGGNYPRGVNDDCSAVIDLKWLPEGESAEGDILPQQDCTRGRDVTANNDRDGAAGFVYRKIASDGEVLRAGAKDWACVLDEITGLLWEVKAAADGIYGNRGLHDGDDVFTWYNSDSRTNGGSIGDWNSRYNQCSGYVAGQPMTYCNIEEFVSRVNKQGLCGFNDWRVPTLPELATLVNFGHTSPAIDTAYFPNTKDEFYWSDSPDAKLEQTAWAVNFQLGFSAGMPRDNGHHVRLVRAWSAEPDNAEPDNAEPDSGAE